MAIYFIVEGPDGAGKTTLVKQLLAANPDAVLGHFGKPETPEQEEDYWKVYADFIKGSMDKRVAILDRCWYSDRVYGPVMRNTCKLTRDRLEVLELMVKACGGGIILYCTGKADVLWKRCKERGETYITCFEQLRDIRDKYEEVMKEAKFLPVVRYDTTVRW